MSWSPPPRRLSTSSKREEDLINAYEAEEERIINILSAKLEQLRQEKIHLENVLEAESESHVNRLTRELSALRFNQLQNGGNSGDNSPEARPGVRAFLGSPWLSDPSPDAMIDAMRRENEELRSRLAIMERDYIRVTRLNDIYREELIDHRGRLGLPVDNLIGLSDPLSQPTRRRQSTSHPRLATSPHVHPHALTRPTHAIPIGNGVPIPRPSSRIHRPSNNASSDFSIPTTHSPESPYYSPVTSPATSSMIPASYISQGTNLTTPDSSASLHSTPPNPHDHPNDAPARILSYPSVPPPSLSSSFGSPTAAYHAHFNDSPDEAPGPSNWSNSVTGQTSPGAYRVAETGSLRNLSRSQSRGRGGASPNVERGSRVAETGSLLPRRSSHITQENPRPSAETATRDEGDGRSARPSIRSPL